MYLYYDSNGALKEFVNKGNINNYDVDTNVYIYIEKVDANGNIVVDENGVYVSGASGTSSFETIKYYLNWFEYDSSVSRKVQRQSIELTSYTTSNAGIPFDRKRDLKYFAYGKTYQFIVITLGTVSYNVPQPNNTTTTLSYNVLSNSDASEIMLSVQVGTKWLGKCVFSVSENGILPYSSINEAQFEYLLSRYAAGPNVSASASVDSGTGTPSCAVTKTQVGDAVTFAFAFSNLNGEDGSDGMGFIKEIITLQSQPVVGTTEFNVTRDKISIDAGTGDYLFALLKYGDTTYLSILYVVNGSYLFYTARCKISQMAQAGATGVGISSIAKTSTSASGLVDTYTITYTSGATSTFNITNGANGNDGLPALVVKSTVGSATIPQVNDIKTLSSGFFNRTPGYNDSVAIIPIYHATSDSLYICTGVMNNSPSDVKLLSVNKVTGEDGAPGTPGADGVNLVCNALGYLGTGAAADYIYSNNTAPLSRAFSFSSFNFTPVYNAECLMLCESLENGASYAVIAKVTYVSGTTAEITKQSAIKLSANQWIGTQAQYDAIQVKDTNTLYFIEE